jgi:hypothetical protein
MVYAAEKNYVSHIMPNRILKLHLGRRMQRILDMVWPLHTALAWDSNPPVPLLNPDTHSRITNWAIDYLLPNSPGMNELGLYRADVVKGANSTELHELALSSSQQAVGNDYSLDLEALRQHHTGTNRGTDDIQGWWEDAETAYQLGEKRRAYFILGIMLHMVEDMGVPAHALNLYHQAPRVGELLAFDNFEFIAFGNWVPDFNSIDQADPGYIDPWTYYFVSESWTQADTPIGYTTSSFSKTWAGASIAERALLGKRQACTCHVVMWTLNSAMNRFAQHG